MIDLYFSPTTNSIKILLFLEESGLAYTLKPVDILSGDQFGPEMRALTPNTKVPVIVDHSPDGAVQPLVVFESGAILLYLAEKMGQFIPADLAGRVEVLKWLFWQVAGLGPMSGQLGHFLDYAPEKPPYAIKRYQAEVNRLYDVLDVQLGRHTWVAGDYSIADMACFGYVVYYERARQDLEALPHVARWLAAMHARPAVQRALAQVPSIEAFALSDAQWANLFAQDRHTATGA